MLDAPLFAYSLSQMEDGWRWRVYDQDGVTVADGADPSRAAAEAAVALLLDAGVRSAEPRSFA
jgi:hypothetical protein